MPPIAVLVLGSGFWGSEWLRTLAGEDDVVIAGTASGRDPVIPPHARLADGYRHDRDYRDALAHTEADAVVITLPTALHADAIERSLDAGLHVLCEKPLATGPDAVQGLLERAAASPDRIVMVGQNYRRRGWAECVRSELAAGVIGEVGHVGLRFRQPEMPLGARAELDNPLLGDMAIHHFDLLRYLTGRNATEIYARQFRPRWSAFRGSPGLDAVIAMEGGIQVSYSGSWAGRGPATVWDGDWHIEGSDGLLTVRDLRVARYANPENDPTTTDIAEVEPQPISVPEPAQTDLSATFGRFRRAIEHGDAPDTAITDNSHSIAMVFAAEESIRLGRPVAVEAWTAAATHAQH